MRNSITDSKRSLPRTRFGELTFGNCLTFTVDGEETFKLIYNELIKAKGCIYIANYDLDPEATIRKGYLSLSKAEFLSALSNSITLRLK